MNLPAGTVLNVFVGGRQVGSITLNTFRAGEVELETERGQAVPAVTNGTAVAVRNQSGANIVTGAFGSGGATPTPTASPTATPYRDADARRDPFADSDPGRDPFAQPHRHADGHAHAGRDAQPDARHERVRGRPDRRGHRRHRAEGRRRVRDRGFNNREFRVRIEDVNLPAGTPLNVLVDGAKVGTLSVAPEPRRAAS